MIENLSTLLSATAPLALMITLWVMAQISRRFGEVTHRPPLYRAFYVALALLICPLGVRLLALGLTENQIMGLGGNTLEALLHDLPLAASITLAVLVTWRYWGWLVYAREGQNPVTPRSSR